MKKLNGATGERQEQQNTMETVCRDGVGEDWEGGLWKQGLFGEGQRGRRLSSVRHVRLHKQDA